MLAASAAAQLLHNTLDAEGTKWLVPRCRVVRIRGSACYEKHRLHRWRRSHRAFNPFLRRLRLNEHLIKTVGLSVLPI